jgi:transcriptional antiterminator NusG
MDFRHWYAIFVMTGQEGKVKALIEQKLSKRDIQARLFVPLIRVTLPPDEAKRRGKDKEDRIMFPGYVLVGTDDIKNVFSIADGLKGILKFLKTDDEFQEIRLEEISRITYMADEDDVIGESEVCLDDDNRIVVLSGPLKGEEGNITRFNRRRGRVAVEFIVGTERHEIWLSVKVIDTQIF